MNKLTINPNECRSGASRGVTFRCNAHIDRKKEFRKKACRKFNKKNYI